MPARRSVARSPFRQLRDVCRFWTDERKQAPCCQFADADALEFEAELFDCETCAVAAHLDGLDADNKRAWDLTGRICTRMLGETRAIGPVLVRLLDDLDTEEMSDMVARVSIVYDAIIPRGKA